MSNLLVKQEKDQICQINLLLQQDNSKLTENLKNRELKYYELINEKPKTNSQQRYSNIQQITVEQKEIIKPLNNHSDSKIDFIHNKEQQIALDKQQQLALKQKQLEEKLQQSQQLILEQVQIRKSLTLPVDGYCTDTSGEEKQKHNTQSDTKKSSYIQSFKEFYQPATNISSNNNDAVSQTENEMLNNMSNLNNHQHITYNFFNNGLSPNQTMKQQQSNIMDNQITYLEDDFEEENTDSDGWGAGSTNNVDKAIQQQGMMRYYHDQLLGQAQAKEMTDGDSGISLLDDVPDYCDNEIEERIDDDVIQSFKNNSQQQHEYSNLNDNDNDIDNDSNKQTRISIPLKELSNKNNSYDEEDDIIILQDSDSEDQQKQLVQNVENIKEQDAPASDSDNADDEDVQITKVIPFTKSQIGVQLVSNNNNANIKGISSIIKVEKSGAEASFSDPNFILSNFQPQKKKNKHRKTKSTKQRQQNKPIFTNGQEALKKLKPNESTPIQKYDAIAKDFFNQMNFKRKPNEETNINEEKQKQKSLISQSIGQIQSQDQIKQLKPQQQQQQQQQQHLKSILRKSSDIQIQKMNAYNEMNDDELIKKNTETNGITTQSTQRRITTRSSNIKNKQQQESKFNLQTGASQVWTSGRSADFLNINNQTNKTAIIPDYDPNYKHNVNDKIIHSYDLWKQWIKPLNMSLKETDNLIQTQSDMYRSVVDSKYVTVERILANYQFLKCDEVQLQEKFNSQKDALVGIFKIYKI